MIRVIDPGHEHVLLTLDGTPDTPPQVLTFVKRHDPSDPSRFPGNTESHPGTTMQSVLRAVAERIQFLDRQIYDENNGIVLFNIKESLWYLEERAARRHARSWETPCLDRLRRSK